MRDFARVSTMMSWEWKRAVCWHPAERALRPRIEVVEPA